MYKHAVLLLLFTNGVLSANILFVAPLPSPSHHIWNRVLALGLVNKGHNVTHIGADVDNSNVTNYTHILLEGTHEKIQETYGSADVDMSMINPVVMILAMQDWTLVFCEHYSHTEGLKKLLNYPENFKFDLILFDITGGGCLYPLLEKFKYPPTVAVTPFLLPGYIGANFGNHLYPAYVPWYGFPYTQEMSFTERLWNFIVTYADVTLKHPKLQTKIENINKKIFGENINSIEEIENQMSIVLVNTDPILGYAQPLAPNIIPVGGLHIKPANTLPQDLQTILDDSKPGAIVFSLGTNVRSDRLGKKTIQALLVAFGKIKETVVWKFESEIENLPKNVIVRKFLPQSDLLGHPKVKLFIGHGGTLSTQEAIYHGVPIIAVPFFLDQHLNAKNIIEKKIGAVMDVSKISSNYVLQNVREVLDNPIYAKNVKKMSELFKDRPETPLEKGIFWTEYVLRHGGAKFLSTPARNLPFYVSSGLDVVVFLVLVVFIVLVVIMKVVKFCVSLLLKKKKIKTN